MVQTSSLFVFTAVALSTVAAIPLGNQPANGGAAQGALQQADAAIQAQDNTLTQDKDRLAFSDERKAKQLEAEAQAFTKQAGNLDPALRPSNTKEREERERKLREQKDRKLREERERKLREERERKQRESSTGNPNRLRTGTAVTSKVPGTPGSLQRRGPPTGTPPVQPAQVNSAQVNVGQQISQQNNELTAMRNKIANDDEKRAKELEREAAAYLKQADYLDPALANAKPKPNPNPNSNFRGSGAMGRPVQKVYRRAGDDNAASAAIATQDKTLTAMKDTDAKKDESKALALEAEAQQFTNQADSLDPALKKPGMGRKGDNKKRKDRKKDGQGMGRQGMDGQRMDRQRPSRNGREAKAAARVARFFFEDDDFFGRDFFDEEELFGRELFDGEELFGREWYDLEELD